jgi:hypothetical protein
MTPATVVQPKKRLLNTGPSRAGAHRLQRALVCPALYGLTSAHGEAGPAVTEERGPLVRGTIGHVALAHHYARRACVEYDGGDKNFNDDPDQFYEPHEAIDIAADMHGALGDEYRELIHKGYDAYAFNYEVEHQKIRAVEYPLEMMIEDPAQPGVFYLFTQREDLVVEGADGRLFIIDHKWVSSAGPSAVNGYAMSIPIIAASYVGWKLFGKRFGGLLLNLIEVGNAPAFKFVRRPPPPAPAMVRSFPTLVARAEKIIAEVDAIPNSDDYPRAAGEAGGCATRYGLCPAWERCRMGKDYVTFDGRTFR